MKDFIINVPLNIKIISWKKNNFYTMFYLYNNSKKFIFFTQNLKSGFQIDRWSNSIVLDKKVIKLNANKFNNLLKNFFKSWNLYFFEKIKFKGKGFRIRFLKKLKLVKFFFGKSHKTFVFFKKIRIKRINKYKFILKNINKEKLCQNANRVVKIRKINFYTLRGLRKSKQIIFKRKGKKGTYI